MQQATSLDRAFRRNRLCGAVVLAVALLAGRPARASALEIKVAEISIAGGTVRAVLELRDVFTSSFQKVIEAGGSLYVRIEAELWEDRAAWDRLVAPNVTITFKVSPNGQPNIITVNDPAGSAASFPAYPSSLPLRVDVAPATRIEDLRKYYMHAIARVGLGGESEIEGVGDAVFGTDRDASGVAAIGKLFFREALRISDYLQSATAETTSRRFTGKQITAPPLIKP